jgi:hypothetical protein
MKKLSALFLTTILLLSSIKQAQAVCPVCTVAVAGGLGISRWIGIDDSVMGIWIGGLILSSGFWMADWASKKSWRIPYPKILSILLMVLFVVPPLYMAKMIGLPGNTLWGIDKILLGTIVGSGLFYAGMRLDLWLRTTNEDKVYIYYQKVIAPVFFLTIGSVIFFLITLSH